MTVSSTTSTKNYPGDGVVVAFPTTFKFLENGDVTAILRDVNNLETTLAETTHYTLTGAGDDAGGTVTMITPHATGEILVIQRITVKTQGTDYVENDPFPAEVHEEALDRLTMITQEVGDVAARAITAPISDTTPALELPAASDRAGMFITFDASGDVQTSTGTGADAGLRTDLAASGGSAVVGYDQGGAGAVVRTVESRLRDVVHVVDFMTTAEITDITSGANTLNVGVALQSALATGRSLVFPGPYTYVASLGYAVAFSIATNGQSLHLNGSTLRLDMSEITIDADNVTIFLGGGAIDQNVPHCTLAADTVAGASTFTVVDTDNIQVGDPLVSSYGDTAGSGEYPLGGPTTVRASRRTITDITGTTVTMSSALTGSTETLPAGLVVGDYYFRSVFYGKNQNFRVDSGRLKNFSGHYYFSPNSPTTTGGRVTFNDVGFESNGLDQFILKKSQTLVINGGTVAQQWDVAKSGVFFDGPAWCYINDCVAHLGNFDSAFNIRGNFNAMSEGEIHVSNSTIIGTTYITSRSTGHASDVLYAIELNYAGTFERIRIKNSDFIGFTRHLISSTTTTKTVSTILNEFTIEGGSVVGPGLCYFIFSGAGNGLDIDIFKSNGVDYTLNNDYLFTNNAAISGAESDFDVAIHGGSCTLEAASTTNNRFGAAGTVVDTLLVSSVGMTHSATSARLIGATLKDTQVAVTPTFDDNFLAKAMERITIDHASWPETPQDIFNPFPGGPNARGAYIASARGVNGSVYYDVVKRNTDNIDISAEFKKAGDLVFLREDDYLFTVGSRILDVSTGDIDKVTFSLATTLTAESLSADTTIDVASVTGVLVGDIIHLLLDDELVSIRTVSSIASLVVTMSSAAGGDAASGNKVCFYRASAYTTSDGTTGGAASAGAGNQYVELDVNGTTYKVLHDGTV